MVNLNDYKSITANHAGNGTSNKFTFIPTTRLIETMESKGWMVNKAMEKKVRQIDKIGFQTHLLRFRRVQDMNLPSVVGEYIPEVVVKNAHDGTSTFEIMAGIFRIVCTNGMIVANNLFSSHKIKHIGYQDSNVIDAVFDVVENTPKIIDSIDRFKSIILTPNEQNIYAQSVLTMKYGEEAKDYSAFSLITPLRYQDTLHREKGADNTLWNTFSIAQEKLIGKGGRIKVQENGRLRRTKAVTSVTENVKLNQAMWELTSKMAELKEAT